MNSKCIIIFGPQDSGKTHTCNNIKKKFPVTVLNSDALLETVISTITKFFNNKEINHNTISVSRILETDESGDKFLDDVVKLIQCRKDFFKKIYRDNIEKINYTLNTQWPLGLIGQLLNPVGWEIMDSLLENLQKEDKFYVFEGVYFDYGTNFRKRLEKSFDYYANIQTVYKPKNNHFWIYNGTTVKSIEKIKEYLDKEKFFDQKEMKEFSKKKKSVIYNYTKQNKIGKLKRFALSKLKKSLKSKSKNVRETYQAFENNEIGTSPSWKKLEKLGIPDDLNGKIVLDVGCNEGFYCFECEKRGARSVGIEYDKHWYNLAIKRKEEFSSKADFYNLNWNNLDDLEYDFDVILLLAVFHYMVNSQVDTLAKFYKKLKSGGLLILETGLTPLNDGQFYVKEVTRKSGQVCQYPNLFSIKKLLTNVGFSEVLVHGESEHLEGESFPRYVIHAIK